jgi:hypothetical protein
MRLPHRQARGTRREKRLGDGGCVVGPELLGDGVPAGAEALA